MNDSRESGVTAADVRLQLRKMLDSKCFRTKQVRASLFRYLVEMTLADEPLNQNKVGRAVFPGFEPGIHDDVRVNASYLRQDLSEYYANEGAEDLVRIELPRGYTPIFSYMPNSKAIALYRQGLHHMGKFDENSISFGMRLLKRAEEAKPDFAPAYAARADALLRYHVLYNWVRNIPYELLPVSPNPIPWLNQAFSLANQAIDYDRHHWRGYLALATVNCCQWRWNDARKAFDEALRLEPHEARSHPWYTAFLLATGQEKEALGIVEAASRQNPENLKAQLAYGLFLYVSRRHDRANEALRAARGLDRTHWVAPFLLGLNDLERNDPAGAGENFLRASRLIYLDLPGDSEHNLFPGFSVLCEIRNGNYDRALGSFSFLPYLENKKPIDHAIAYMAREEWDHAMAALENASTANDPIMMWLHLWPIFDSLRRKPRFQALIARMNLPSHRS